jgi:hypothetical protein
MFERGIPNENEEGNRVCGDKSFAESEKADLEKGNKT